MRQFIERWYDEGGVAFDVFFDSDVAQFEVLTNESVVFRHTTFVEVLRWCMRDDAAVPARVDAIEVSPPWECGPEDL